MESLRIYERITGRSTFLDLVYNYLDTYLQDLGEIKIWSYYLCRDLIVQSLILSNI